MQCAHTIDIEKSLTFITSKGFGKKVACETLRVLENGVLRRIFGPKRDEVTKDWKKLHNEELHNLYSSPDIIRMIKSRRIRWAWHVARMGANGNSYRIFVGKPERKRPLGRPRSMWVDNIKIDLRERQDKHNSLLKVAVNEMDFMAHPLYIGR
jgi:hypothetical protein